MESRESMKKNVENIQFIWDEWKLNLVTSSKKFNEASK